MIASMEGDGTAESEQPADLAIKGGGKIAD